MTAFLADRPWAVPSFIALLALVFTIASFWWVNVRRGRLKSFEPHSFAAAVLGTRDLLVRIPLVLYNTGAAPIVIQDMRLTFPNEPRSVLASPWRTSRSQLKPASDDGHAFPAVFAVPGRTAVQLFIEFGAPFPGFKLEAKDYMAKVEVILGHKKKWRRLLSFTLRAGNISAPDQYITYSNSPSLLTKEDRAKVKAAVEDLASKLDASRAQDAPSSPADNDQT